jgi:hypothetical protein
MIGSIRHGTLPFQDMKKAAALQFASVSKCNRVRSVGIGVRRRSFCETRSIPFYRSRGREALQMFFATRSSDCSAAGQSTLSGKRGRLA